MNDDEARRLIDTALAALAAGEQARSSMSATVELDQTRTGRLSRMDALASQQMAAAGQRRAQEQRQRLQAALRRLEAGEYGLCLDCDEPVAEARLRADPAASLCISCANARENR